MIKADTLNTIMEYLWNDYKLIIKSKKREDIYQLGYDSIDDDLVKVIKLNYTGVYIVDKENKAIIIEV